MKVRAGGGLGQGRGSWDAEEGQRSEPWGRESARLEVMMEGGKLIAGDPEIPDLADRENDSAEMETAENNGQ